MRKIGPESTNNAQYRLLGERLEEVGGLEKAVTSNDIKEDVVMEKCEMLQ